MERKIVVEVVVETSLEKAWEYWNDPEHIVGWAFDSDDWKVSQAENDLRIGGTFKVRTQTKDGSESVDFVGKDIRTNDLIEYDLEDGRRVSVRFTETPEGVRVTEDFQPEEKSPVEDQRAGWQATLQNFKSYVESS